MDSSYYDTGMACLLIARSIAPIDSSCWSRRSRFRYPCVFSLFGGINSNDAKSISSPRSVYCVNPQGWNLLSQRFTISHAFHRVDRLAFDVTHDRSPHEILASEMYNLTSWETFSSHAWSCGYWIVKRVDVYHALNVRLNALSHTMLSDAYISKRSRSLHAIASCTKCKSSRNLELSRSDCNRRPCGGNIAPSAEIEVSASPFSFASANHRRLRNDLYRDGKPDDDIPRAHRRFSAYLKILAKGSLNRGGSLQEFTRGRELSE